MARKATEDNPSGVAPAAAEATAEQVAAFLSANPGFLAGNPDLLTRMQVPARWRGGEEGGGAAVVDLQQVMIDRLRGQLEEMRGCAEHLITTSRNNMSVQARTHHAVLALLAATGMEQVARVVNDEFPHLLDVDVATLCFETGGRAVPELSAQGIQRLPLGAVDHALGGAGRDVALREHSPGDPALFAGGAGLVQSFALARLAASGRAPCGLLALGARDPEAFHAGQGSELLSFLARVIESAVRRWVPGGE